MCFSELCSALGMNLNMFAWMNYLDCHEVVTYLPAYLYLNKSVDIEQIFNQNNVAAIKRPATYKVCLNSWEILNDNAYDYHVIPTAVSEVGYCRSEQNWKLLLGLIASSACC
jgi:hypothetical protein